MNPIKIEKVNISTKDSNKFSIIRYYWDEESKKYLRPTTQISIFVPQQFCKYEEYSGPARGDENQFETKCKANTSNILPL